MTSSTIFDHLIQRIRTGYGKLRTFWGSTGSTSLQRHKWLQSKLQTTSYTIFLRSFSYSLDRHCVTHFFCFKADQKLPVKGKQSEQNEWYHVKENEKLYQKMVSEIVVIFVNGHLCLLKGVIHIVCTW